MSKVYGPYLHKNGRKYVVHANGRQRRSQSYSRYLMEQHLGRELEEWEHVDHINDDFTDDRIENLQILTQAENNRKSSKPTLVMIFTCPVCSIRFEREAYRYRAKQLKRDAKGPYCTQSCASKDRN